MYINLIEILNRKKISMKDLAKFLGVTEKTVQNKVNGRNEFTLSEAFSIVTFICPEYRMDFVFAKQETEALETATA